MHVSRTWRASTSRTDDRRRSRERQTVIALDLPGLPPCVAASRSGESGDGLPTANSPDLEHRWIGAEVIAEHKAAMPALLVTRPSARPRTYRDAMRTVIRFPRRGPPPSRCGARPWAASYGNRAADILHRVVDPEHRRDRAAGSVDAEVHRAVRRVRQGAGRRAAPGRRRSRRGAELLCAVSHLDVDGHHVLGDREQAVADGEHPRHRPSGGVDEQPYVGGRVLCASSTRPLHRRLAFQSSRGSPRSRVRRSKRRR